MKLASLKQGRDGVLVVVSRDLTRAVKVPQIAATLQAALDDWAIKRPHLEATYQRLNDGLEPDAFYFDQARQLGGHHIGEGAVVSANTTVGKKVEPYAIVAGQGGKTVGHRVRGLNYKVGGKGLFTLLH